MRSDLQRRGRTRDRKGQATLRRARMLTRVLAAITVLALTAGCSRVFAPPLTTEPKNLFAVAKPATMMILADFKARVTVPHAAVNQERITAALTDEMLSGRLDPNDTQAGIAEYYRLLLSEPLKYLEPDQTRGKRAVDTRIQASGSGFIADPKGFVVTNAHVAAPKEADLKKELAGVGLESFVKQDAQAIVDSTGGQISKELFDQLLNALATFDAHYLAVEKLDRTVSVVQGANIPGVAQGAKLIPAEVVTAGEPIPGKDVAVLKIEQTNLPSLPIGDDSRLGTGDKLYVVGYPADATFHPVLSEESFIEPSFTGGQVSAKKQAVGGFGVIQTDAASRPGGSGGPVLDSSGQVIGILTFGSIDPSTGQMVQGFNFIMPASLIKQFLDRAGAHPVEGTFTRMWKDGLAEEAAGHNKDALAVFQQLNGLSPGHPYVQQRITENEEAVAAGKDKSVSPIVAFGVPLAVLVLIGGGVGFVMIRKRKGGGPERGATAQQPAYEPQARADAAQTGGSRSADLTQPMTSAPPQPQATAPMPSAAEPTTPMPPTPTAPMPPASAGEESARSRLSGAPQTRDECLEEIRKLSELRDAGAITDEEFQAKKKELLDKV